MSRDYRLMEEIEADHATEATRTLSEYQTEVRRAHRRIILCLVGLSVVVGLFLYFIK